MLSAAGVGAGRCFGWQPAANVSMMIMRPPQDWQGRGSMWGSPEAVALDVSSGFRHTPSILAHGAGRGANDALLRWVPAASRRSNFG